MKELSLWAGSLGDYTVPPGCNDFSWRMYSPPFFFFFVLGFLCSCYVMFVTCYMFSTSSQSISTETGKLISSLFSRQLCYRGWAICKLRHSLIDGDPVKRLESMNVPTSRKGCGDSVYIGSTKIIPTGVSDINRLKRIVFILLQLVVIWFHPPCSCLKLSSLI